MLKNKIERIHVNFTSSLPDNLKNKQKNNKAEGTII